MIGDLSELDNFQSQDNFLYFYKSILFRSLNPIIIETPQ